MNSISFAEFSAMCQLERDNQLKHGISIPGFRIFFAQETLTIQINSVSKTGKELLKYEVDLDQIKNNNDLLKTIMHLHEKDWTNNGAISAILTMFDIACEEKLKHRAEYFIYRSLPFCFQFNSYIYVVMAESTNKVKIGFAKDVKKRLKSLATGCPYELKLITSFPASMQYEKEIHKKFSKHRSRGEWFDYKDEIVAWVDSLKEGFNLNPKIM